MTLVLRCKNEVKQATDIRTCKKCGINKPLTDYYKSGKNTWRRKCKDCYKARCKKTRKEKPDLNAEYCNRWRYKNKEKFNEYMRNYQKAHYDPVKNHIKYVTYYWGRTKPVLSC